MEQTVRAMIQYVLFWDPVQIDNRAQAIDAYVGSLRPFPSPALTPDGLNAAAGRGKQVFNQLSCGTCHPDSNYFTDQEKHAGYRSLQDSGPHDGNWDTPTLYEIWRSAPYMHDGGAATLKDVFRPPYNHGLEDQTITNQQLNDLVEYLRTL
jgi:cytochrome c peroxidase